MEMRSMRSLLVVLVSGLVFAGSAQATVIDGRPIFQRWADQARVPTPDATIRIIEAWCPYSPEPGCSVDDTVWVGNSSRRMFLHELGHQFDARVLTDADRTELTALLGRSGDWHALDAEWRDRPAEDFADAYMLCARRDFRRGEWRFPRFEPHPDMRVCHAIRDAART